MSNYTNQTCLLLHPEGAVPKGLRILLVDDEQDVLSAIALLLGVDGHKVISAKSGIQAIELLEHVEVDLVITDYRMEGMSGDRLAGRIKDRWPLPIIMLTGFVPVPPGAENPVDAILTKPCGLADLRAAIGRLGLDREN